MRNEKTSRRGVKAIGDGRYQLRIYVDGRDYVRTVKAASVKEAAKIRDRLADEIRGSSAPELLSNAAAAWLDRKVRAKRADGTSRFAPTTIEGCKRAVAWIVPLLGHYHVSDLTPAIVRDWRDAIAEELASTTVNTHLRKFREILREHGVDVASKVPVLEQDDQRITEDEPNLLDKAELQRFLAAARGRREAWALMLFLVVTGARVSTAIAVRWEDLDPAAGVVHLRRRLSHRTMLPGVKRSRASKDLAPLLPALYTALLEHRERQTDEQRASGFVFSTSRKPTEPIRRTEVLRMVERVRTDAGITKRITTHGLRRTAALHYRLAASSTLAMEVLGHQTEAMHRHYAPEQAEERFRAAERAFGELLEDPGNVLH